MTTPNYYHWDDLPETAMAPHIGRRVIGGEKMTVVMFNLAKGAIVAQHKHPHEQIICVLTGRIEFESSGGRWVLTGGDVVHLPSNIPHGGTATEDTVTIEVFSPPREDYLASAPRD